MASVHAFELELGGMPFYRNSIYPLLVDRLGDPPPIRRIRRELIPRAQGAVLEIGVGSGANFMHYDPQTVHKLYALEPNPGMTRLAQRRGRATTLNIQFVDLRGEAIALDSGTVDTVVSTFTLGTIPGITDAIRGLGRVLRPNGTLIFLELGLAPDPAVQRWQRRLEPTFHRLFQGLYLTRDIPSLLERNGFQLEHIEARYLVRFPRALSYCWWGTAKWRLSP